MDGANGLFWNRTRDIYMSQICDVKRYSHMDEFQDIRVGRLSEYS